MAEGQVQSDSAMRYLIAFQALSHKALTAKNTEEILNYAVEALEVAFQAALAQIWLVQPDETLLLKASAGLSCNNSKESSYLINPKDPSNKIGSIANSRLPFISNEINEDDEFDQEWVRQEGLISVAVSPLLNGEQLEGIIVLYSRQPFNPIEQQAVATFASHITLSIRQTIMKEELQRQERLATLGQLAGAVAHDLRAPLARITTAVELLEEPLSACSDYQKYLEFINRAINDMGEIIGSLLDYARMVAIGRTTCDLRGLLDEVLIETMIPPRIKIHIELDHIDPIVSINHSQMKRAFMNLVKNAIEAMPQSGTLTINGKEQDNFILINITDTGTGIEPENLEKIFSPLFTKTVRGTGFGLSASRSIIEAHGGKIQVSSELGRGSTFTISLPQIEE